MHLFFKDIFILVFGCGGSSLLHEGFLWLQVWAPHCIGFSCGGAQALGMWASVVTMRGFRSCGSQALERRLSSCGAGLSRSVACGIVPDQG